MKVVVICNILFGFSKAGVACRVCCVSMSSPWNWFLFNTEEQFDGFG